MTEQRRKEQKRKEKNRLERSVKESTACGKPAFQREKVENSVGNRASRGIYIPDKRLLWTCPYYKWDDENGVRCEGGRLGLPTSEAEKDYIMTYCADHLGWKRCTVARAITRHYESLDAL